MLERVLRAFESSSLRFAQQLVEARQRNDMPAIRQVAHTLKSSSASIGALELSRLCAEIELSIRTASLAGIADRLDAMDRELATVIQAVKSMLGVSPGP